MSGGHHLPVMLSNVVAALNPRDGAIYVDGTFGGGGYSRALLGSARCQVFGIDRDPDARSRGDSLVSEFDGRLTLLSGCFGDMISLLAERNIDTVDGVTLDLGVSSFQIDHADRGFSFRVDGPLDMRMSREGPSAADIVNSEPEDRLADIIFQFGEERRSRRIARAIAIARNEAPITRTERLAEIVRRSYPPGASHSGAKSIDPATRTFQALRIYINDELGELARGLQAAEVLLRDGGRLAVVSFHSLEDRIVKSFLRERSGGTPRSSRHAPQTGPVLHSPSFSITGRRMTRPSKGEIVKNPRSRSARLRTATRTSAPAWPQDNSFAGSLVTGGIG